MMERNHPLSMLSVAILLISVLLTITSCGALPEPGRRYALIYGISVYNPDYSEGRDVNLRYADDDARDLAGVLEAAGYETLVRIDSAATLENFMADTAYLHSVMTENDMLLFHFSGHGVPGNANEGQENEDTLFEPVYAAGDDTKDEYLMLYGSVESNPLFLNFGLALSDDELSSVLDALPGSRKVVTLDNCYSGGFIGAGDAVDITAPSQYDRIMERYSEGIDTAVIWNEALRIYREYSETPGYDISSATGAVLAAAGEDEESYDYWFSSTDNHENGVFTYFLIEALQNVDTDGDGSGDADTDGNNSITLLEAYAHACSRITSEWNEHPDIGSSNHFLPHISSGPRDFVLVELN